MSGPISHHNPSEDEEKQIEENDQEDISEIKVEEYQSTSYEITDLSFGSLYEIDVVSNYNGVMYANPITLQTLYEDNVYDVSFGTYAFNNEVTYALRFESDIHKLTGGQLANLVPFGGPNFQNGGEGAATMESCSV